MKTSEWVAAIAIATIILFLWLVGCTSADERPPIVLGDTINLRLSFCLSEDAAMTVLHIHEQQGYAAGSYAFISLSGLGMCGTSLLEGTAAEILYEFWDEQREMTMRLLVVWVDGNPDKKIYAMTSWPIKKGEGV